VIKNLSDFALQYKDLPTLGFTHFQPAVNYSWKRATLWLQSLLLDFEELEFFLETLRFRGVKGTTGTAASFLELFDGDYAKVQHLDKELSKRLVSRKFLAFLVKLTIEKLMQKFCLYCQILLNLHINLPTI
jgi:adenylosuccinate lyase